MTTRLEGVYAAAVTPILVNGAPDLEALPGYLGFLAARGCHGALMLGTTGEGPSFSALERQAIWAKATEVWEEHPDFVLMAGTGTPSLIDTIEFNKQVFELGYQAVVVLPPYFFRTAGDEGLFDWYADVLQASVPDGKQLLGYHIPAVSGVGLSADLLERLAAEFPRQFGGIKDSSGDLEHGINLIRRLADQSVLVGNDQLLGPALEAGAAGSITALASLYSPLARQIWDAHQAGEDTSALQEEMDRARAVLDERPPAPAFLKAMLHELHSFEHWPVRAPLRDFAVDQVQEALSAMKAL